ncbi:MAG: RNA 2',3'-cyclic phosphodiesterase [Rhodospirillales bacterium]|nr:RNA 2',3'-cyclic phosphodiesterase [Rhodospirillales bacterium]
MMRLFIGLSLPGPVRERLQSLQSGLPGARWVKPENLHMTLRFIGEVADDAADDLDAALAGVTAPAFEFRLKGLDTFGSARKLRSLWLGAEPPEPLVHLHAKIETVTQRTGFAAEGRKFKPHVTLARFNGGRPARLGDYLHAHAGFEAVPVPVDVFTLFRSHLGHGGSHYQHLADYPLHD